MNNRLIITVLFLIIANAFTVEAQSVYEEFEGEYEEYVVLDQEDIKNKEDDNRDVEFDFAAPPKTNIQLSDNLSMGARAEVEYTREDNLNLDSNNPEDEASIESSVSLSFLYRATERFKAFLNVEPGYLAVDDEENKKKDRTKFELVQAFLAFEGIVDGTDLILGRQRFKDPYEWIYDEEMDGIRLTHMNSHAAYDFSVSKENRDDLRNHEDDGIDTINYTLHSRFILNEDNQLGAYVMLQKDGDTFSEDHTFFGLQLGGELTDRLDYWINLAYVRGENSTQDIRAYGGDAMALYKISDDGWKPTLILGYASGSGDDNPSDSKDENFRQTGLQDNDSKLSGVAKVKYYGELVDPELSNISIYTLGFGVKPTRKSSLELIYHHFRQNEAASKLRDTQIDVDPNGVDKDLGHELDLVAGWKFNKDIKITLAIGYFVPGDAFGGSPDDAFFAEGKFRYSF